MMISLCVLCFFFVLREASSVYLLFSALGSGFCGIINPVILDAGGNKQNWLTFRKNMNQKVTQIYVSIFLFFFFFTAQLLFKDNTKQKGYTSGVVLNLQSSNDFI